jgi:sarcosine oxidase, subunit alpha
MTPVTPGMRVTPLEGLPGLPAVEGAPAPREVERREVPVLVIGGGPAGLSAATQLGEHGVRALLIDDKDRLGGKLVLQTHRFFGEVDAVYAGTRGIDIAQRLARGDGATPRPRCGASVTALAVFSDGWVGVLRGRARYVLVKPEVLLVAAGAREKALTFRGNTLPGVYGAGAFQTLLNRDLVRDGRAPVRRRRRQRRPDHRLPRAAGGHRGGGAGRGAPSLRRVPVHERQARPARGARSTPRTPCSPPTATMPSNR